MSPLPRRGPPNQGMPPLYEDTSYRDGYDYPRGVKKRVTPTQRRPWELVDASEPHSIPPEDDPETRDRHFTILGTIRGPDVQCSLPILCDTGSAGYSLIDSSLVQLLNLPLVPLKTPRIALDFEGVEHSNITHLARVDLVLGDHRSTTHFLVTPLRSNTRIILGMPWLCRHEAIIQASKDRSITITFSSSRCLQNCCTDPVTIQALSEADLTTLEPYQLEPFEAPPRSISPSATRYRKQRNRRRRNQRPSNTHETPLEVSAIAFHYLAKK